MGARPGSAHTTRPHADWCQGCGLSCPALMISYLLLLLLLRRLLLLPLGGRDLCHDASCCACVLSISLQRAARPSVLAAKSLRARLAHLHTNSTSAWRQRSSRISLHSRHSKQQGEHVQARHQVTTASRWWATNKLR